ncbi:phosphoenolpyruvate synthase, partial [bacterium]|nr:phosphoenolpyruvate synthase [bacterium]
DPDEESVLWDNSNIVESYPGITLPLTFSFARTVYSAVYRQFCFALGVERALVDANPDAFEMLGHWKGRFYYNLRNWYRVLMMLPGYRVNAGFMETMMGVKEPLREKPSIRPSRRPEWLRVCSTIIGVACQALTLDSRVKDFMRRFDEIVTPLEERDFRELSCAELAALYDDLQREFVAGWRTPLVNDFFAMVAYGSLKKSLVKWGVDAGGSAQNDILVGVGDIVSAEPMRRLAAMAELVRGDAELKKALASGDAAAFTAEIPNHPAFASEWTAYLKKFGGRCMGELKLETVTYDMDPEPLVAMLRGYAAAPLPEPTLPKEPDLSALNGHPLRRFLFKLLRSRARRYVSNRENLRFERTRLFVVIRRIMLAFGARLHAAGFLDAPRDVFYLEMPEVLGFALGCADPGTFRELVNGRKALYAKYEKEPALPERFETRGGVIVPQDETPSGPVAAPESDGTLKGLGCCRGVVRGKATVIRDLSCAGDTAGRILVAERTDPGWGPLFPLAKGVLVERGSVLSHAAILTRELGIPCVVGVKGLLSAVATGDEIELDGAAGTVRLIAKGGA